MKQVHLKASLPDPERWCDRPDRLGKGTAAENAIGAAFKRVRQATEPSDAALASLARHMDDRPSRSTMRDRLVWRVALVTALIMAMGGAVGAALKIWRYTVTTSGQMPASHSTIAPTKNVKGRRGGRVAAALEEPSVASAPTGAAASATAEPVAVPPVAVSPVAVSPVAVPSVAVPPVALPPVALRPRNQAGAGAGSEAGLLAIAFRELRSGGDAASALRALDQYDRRFHNGALQSEARIARAEALLTLDRRAEALPLLEGIEEHGGAVTRDVQIARGELFVDTGRCANAVRDFNTILASTDGDTAGGRALYGRASCHLMAGDLAAARRDLRRYLSLHPDGGLATAARHALDLLP